MDDNNLMNENPNGQYDPNMQYNPNGQYDPNMQYNPNGQYGSYNYNYYQQPYQQESIYAKPGERSATDGWGVAALICGILAILTCCCYGVGGIVFGIAAIVLACVSKKESGGIMPSIALAGMICGIVGIVLGLCFLGIMIVGIMDEMGSI